MAVTKYKKVSKPSDNPKESNSMNCPGCGWEWTVNKPNIGICPECGNKFKTSGWPVFSITWEAAKTTLF